MSPATSARPDGADAGRRRLVIETDGGARGNPGPAGYGALVRDASGAVLAERADFLGITTNNVAEYSGLVAGLRAAREIDPDALVEVRADSKLLVEQMSGRWQIKHEQMRRLAAEARAAFPPAQVRYTWVPRSQNGAADALANEAMDHRRAVARDRPAAAAGRGVARPEEAGPGGGGRAPSSPVPTGESSAGGERPAPPRALGATMRFGAGEPLTVVLVRHGQTDMTAARAFAGGDGPGASLNARGRTEAARAADLVRRIGGDAWPDLPPVSAVFSSSMLRTQQTAGAIGRRVGVRVEIDDAFAECRFGEWEGLTAAEIEERWPGALHRWYADPAERAVGGESMRDVAERVRRGVDDLARRYAGRTVAVSTHTIAVRAGIGSVTGMAPGAWSSLRVPPASLTILRLWPDGHEVTALGCPSDL